MSLLGRLINITSDNESDEDVVTDYTLIGEQNCNYLGSKNDTSPEDYYVGNKNKYQKTNMKLNTDDCKLKSLASNNMVPLISVTPHSPGTMYNVLEDTLNHLQSFRENVILMKNSSPLNKHKKFILPEMHTSKLFSSCPSLQDLSQSNNFFWQKYNNNMRKDNYIRRKSWTAIEDLTDCTKQSHKSLSLSSLDSEEPIMIRKNCSRGNRNSTGGISTHSLNEAELISDFERIISQQGYINLENMESTSHVPLQKSISTPSIVATRSKNSKEDNSLSLSGHLSDSEDDLRGDNHLLGVRDKNLEEYSDTTGKRRKRGSLFFRKKKEKNKTKNLSTTCDTCGMVINMVAYKDHLGECKGKIAKKFVQSQHLKLHQGKKVSSNSRNASQHDEGHRDFYCGHSQNDQSNCSDDVPLMRDEFLNETPIGPHDLGAEPILGLAIDEFDSWSPSVPRDVLKSLKDKPVKRQEHIYEFIMTEKHHCQTLLVMQKVIVESLEKHVSHLYLGKMFPRLTELTELHTNFLMKLRLKQRENYIVDSIADILLDFFSSISAQKLKNSYGEFCSNHLTALETFKFLSEDQKFCEWYKLCQQNPLLKKKGIPECILFVTQRLTKYPLLIDPLMKSSKDDKIEQDKLQRAMILVKEILIEVDARVADKEKEDRQLDIFKKIDAKSFSLFKDKQFKKHDIIGNNRKLKFEGVATLMQGRSKMLTVLVVVLSDCLFFLSENSQKYTFFTPGGNRAGVVTLQKLLIREKAGTESRSIYIISSNPNYPEMFELKVQSPKDKNIWIQAIRAAVLECPTNEIENEDIVKHKQKLIREIMSKMRQKDCEQAILLEEKVSLQLRLLLDNPNDADNLDMESFFTNYGSYRDLITDDCDTREIWKRVLSTVQEISHLASTLYTAATGLPLSRSYSSVGERQSEVYISPTLPKRAETFGGFDERRIKTGIIPSRDAVLSTLSSGYFSNREHIDKNNLSSDFNPYYLQPNSPNSSKSSTDNLKNDITNDNNYAALQVSHHLHTILCIVSQQMTTIQSLQNQLNDYRDNPKATYRHNDQLEELRNLQDKLQDEKTNWSKTREEQEQKLEEQHKAQKLLQEQIKLEQEDIKHQREQLYRKMEILSNQGLLLSPSVALPIQVSNTISHSSEEMCLVDDHTSDNLGNTASVDRRKEKWRTASVYKSSPGSSTNSTKTNQATVKQQLPLKLSSMASTKTSSLGSPGSTQNHSTNVGGITQMFPLKLADKKNHNIIPSHTRTGSSPAVVQQQNPTPSGNPATRTNTYPKIPERFRLKSTDGSQSVVAPPHHDNQSEQLRSPVTTRTYGNSDELEKDGSSLAADEKVIYF